MKISSYTLFAILPFTIQSVIATPVAEPDFDTLEERGGGNHKDWDKDWDNNWWNGHHDKNVCEVKQTYPYYKYPCSSSPSNGTSLLGATFTSFCKYHFTETEILEFGMLPPRDGSKKETSLANVPDRRCLALFESIPVGI
ncbi:hypothetical protein N7450_009290 [Penicillium hetheringtonii]|uniref:Uncharacterized protein n=1 Tax=Penicillium hetheringtonii TaxID=911720 RepID=A0AAD6DEM9_9EURO|nr:hypothetical protein N7450_009290 [Penicillium hetheringtonii]